MRRIFVTIVISVVGSAVIAFFNISYSNRIAEVFYTICGILFSVGMSQIMAFDFSKVADDDNYLNLTLALSSVRSSFIIQFIIASMAFLVFQVLKSNNGSDLIVSVLKWQFNVYVFLNFIIVYSLFFFIYNFHKLVQQKLKIDIIIHNEEQES